PVPSPGMAARHTTNGEPAAAERAVPLEGLQCVRRATGVESAWRRASSARGAVGPDRYGQGSRRKGRRCHAAVLSVATATARETWCCKSAYTMEAGSGPAITR